jgi:phosphopantetheinyl transferase (holo-ACP synthase)
MLLGNDVVDRKDPGAEGKHLDGRFLARVFTREEAICIREASEPSLALWMIWSAKESVFKVMSKLDPELIFSHRDFAVGEEFLVRVLETAASQGRFDARITYKDDEFALLLSWNDDYVHCLAGWRRRGVLEAEELEALTAVRVEQISPHLGELSERELDSVHSPESRQVRLLAKRLLKEHHELDGPELVRERGPRRFLPPTVQEKGLASPGIDLSLSHDGRFVAAAITAQFNAAV